MIRNVLIVLATAMGLLTVGMCISKPSQPVCFSEECFVGGDCEEDFHCRGDNCVCNDGRCGHATTDG